jgi:glutamate synthase domain-containing protein 3
MSSTPVRIEMPIRNINRAVGAILSNRIVRKYGPKGLPDGTLEVVLRGSAGQSFGAFLPPGVTLRLIGESNDYLGKSLSGGRIVVQMPEGSPFMAHENIIAGNTLLYGATSGEVFINGVPAAVCRGNSALLRRRGRRRPRLRVHDRRNRRRPRPDRLQLRRRHERRVGLRS